MTAQLRRENPEGHAVPAEETKGEASQPHVDHAEIEALFQAAQAWGEVREGGAVWLREEGGPGRLVGRIEGDSVRATLVRLARRFDKLRGRLEALQAEIEAAPSSVTPLAKVRRLAEELPAAEALGDFTELRGALARMEEELLRRVEANRKTKERLCESAESHQEATDWRETDAVMRGLQEEWKKTGSAGRDADHALWQRLKRAQDSYYSRRSEAFEKRRGEEEQNRLLKEELCAKAEGHAASTEWNEAGEHLRALQEEWKAVGHAGHPLDGVLWKRFRDALDAFFEARNAFYKDRDHARRKNREAKERLCAKAEELALSTDWRSTADAMKAMQLDWRAIGHVGREADDLLWKRFRAAQDRFFAARTEFFNRKEEELREALEKRESLCAEVEALLYLDDLSGAAPRLRQLEEEWRKAASVVHFPREKTDDLWRRFRSACHRAYKKAREDREKKRAEWLVRMRSVLSQRQEQATRLRESIEHDEGNVCRWRASQSTARSDEVRQSLAFKIADVESKVAGKRERLAALDASIADLAPRVLEEPRLGRRGPSGAARGDGRERSGTAPQEPMASPPDPGGGAAEVPKSP